MKKKYNIAIIGFGGHTHSLLNLIDNDEYNIIGIFDDSFNENIKEHINGIKLIGKLKDLPNHTKLVLSIGDNDNRKLIFNKEHPKILDNNLIHKNSIIEPSVDLGKSNQFFSNTLLNSKVSIGDNNIVNSGAILEHEVVIGSHNHISIGSILCGKAKIGDSCFLGAGSVVINNIKITDNVIVGANSVVLKNINQSGTYVGNPARKIK